MFGGFPDPPPLPLLPLEPLLPLVPLVPPFPAVPLVPPFPAVPLVPLELPEPPLPLSPDCPPLSSSSSPSSVELRHPVPRKQPSVTSKKEYERDRSIRDSYTGERQRDSAQSLAGPS